MSNDITADTTRTWAIGDCEPPKPGMAKQIAPGILWIRIPMPLELTHINVWAVKDKGGWAIFDTGLHNSKSVSVWRELFADSNALNGEKITRVFVTHMHPDHVGMAGWLTRKFDCELWMTQVEYLNCRILVADTGRKAPEEGVRFYRRAGWDESELDDYYRARFGNYGKMIYAMPESYRRVHDGDSIRIGDDEWEVVVGSGHSPEHACFYCAARKLFISGDQVLPRISSNVSVFPTEPYANPLHDWITSIDKIKHRVPDDVTVLPAHKEVFTGLHARLQALKQGRVSALKRLYAGLNSPARAVDVFGSLFTRNVHADPESLGFATGEALAHLNFLVQRGDVIEAEDENGVAWYGRNEAAAAKRQ